MKALILAGGRGKRLGNVTEGLNKCMLEIQSRPLIEYSLMCVAQIPVIREVVIVVGYRPQDIRGKFGSAYRGKDILYVSQDEQHGLVHAIECARPALGSDDFMLMLGDELMINPRHKEFIAEFQRGGMFALCGVVKVEDRSLIKRTYSIVQLPEGRISRLVEKPNHPTNDIMGTGNCIFKNRILDYISHTPINQNRNEKELPDLIQCAIDDGHDVRSFFICREYVNVNSPEELDKTQSYFAHL